ncbi:MAG: ORF6N domain-containing protein [bacterium]
MTGTVSRKRQAISLKRNQKRSPDDFCFQLTEAEWHSFRLQNATSKGRVGRRKPPKFLARVLPFLYTTPNEISIGQASCFSPGSGTVSCVPPPGAA